MTADELRSFLTQRRVKFKESDVQHGKQFRCTAGEIFNVYQTGRISIQGKDTTDLAKAVFAWDESGSVPAAVVVAEPSTGATPTAQSVGPDRRVFIVYGHDNVARDNLELLLRRMGLEPIILQNLPAGGDTIIEKLDHYLGQHGNVGFACALLTPRQCQVQLGSPPHPIAVLGASEGAQEFLRVWLPGQLVDRPLGP